MADAFTNKRLRDRSLKKEHTVFVSCKKTSKGKWPTRHKPGKESATSEDQGREDERLEFGLRNSPCIIQWLPLSRYKTTYQIDIDNLDIDDTKNTAYLLTLYGATYKNDSSRHTTMYNNLASRLQTYKYKKNVEKFDDETLGYIELFKGMIDV